MSDTTVDPFKRHAVKGHAGIYFRLRADGKTRSYSVHVNGKFVAAGATQAEAIAKQAELRGKKARGETIRVNDKTTFAQLAASWWVEKEKRLRPRSVASYRAALDLVLLPRFGAWHVTAIDVDAVAKLISDLETKGLNAVDAKRPVRPLGRSSVDAYTKPLQAVLALAVRRGIRTTNPFDQLLADDRPEAPTREIKEWTTGELEALFAASTTLARRSTRCYDFTPLLRLTARLGLRQGEVLGLRWQDFDATTCTLSLTQQWTRDGVYAAPKTKAGIRTIPLPDDVVETLSFMRDTSAFPADGDPIFASKTGTPLEHRSVARWGFDPAAALAGLEGVTFHSLRHAAASRLIDGGLDPVTVAAILGHENANITLGLYAHLFDAQAKADAIRDAL
jgi:integrase